MNSGLVPLLLSITMLGVLLLAAGGAWLVLRRDYRKGGLMLVAALVFLINVLIWTI